MGFIQYLKDTRGELHHVAWPTRVQTIIFTVLVVLLSVVVSLYLGFFDYVFTTGLGKAIEIFPGSAQRGIQIENVQTETVPAPTIDIDTVIPTDTQ